MLLTLIMLGLSGLSLAQPVAMPATNALAKRGYPLTCNSENINPSDAAAAISDLRTWDNGPQYFCGPMYGARKEMNDGNAYITTYPYNTKDKTITTSCNKVADAVQTIWDTCGSRGGSAEVPGHPNIVAHLNNHFV